MGTSVLATKFTCDEKGNWIEVPVILTRKGSGWVEDYPPSVRGDARKAVA